MGWFKKTWNKVKKETRRATKKAKDKINETSAEDWAKLAGSFMSGTYGGSYLADKLLRDAGIKATALVNPSGWFMGEIAEKYIDKPKAEKEAEKRFQAMVADEQARQMKQFRRREAQAGAEKDASEELLRRRKRQERRRAKIGGGGTGTRQGTILTGASIATGSTLGSAGGMESGKKTKLGS